MEYSPIIKKAPIEITGGHKAELMLTGKLENYPSR